MNREIKFRAWDKKEKEMIRWLDSEPDGQSWYGVPELEDYAFDGSSRFVPMQFTGLHDKNGKEIYEGDVLEVFPWETCDKGVLLEVIFDKGIFGFYKHVIDYPVSIVSEVKYIIRGNIFENPDLLK